MMSAIVLGSLLNTQQSFKASIIHTNCLRSGSTIEPFKGSSSWCECGCAFSSLPAAVKSAGGMKEGGKAEKRCWQGKITLMPLNPGNCFSSREKKNFF